MREILELNSTIFAKNNKEFLMEVFGKKYNFTDQPLWSVPYSQNCFIWMDRFQKTKEKETLFLNDHIIEERIFETDTPVKKLEPHSRVVILVTDKDEYGNKISQRYIMKGMFQYCEEKSTDKIHVYIKKADIFYILSWEYSLMGNVLKYVQTNYYNDYKSNFFHIKSNIYRDNRFAINHYGQQLRNNKFVEILLEEKKFKENEFYKREEVIQIMRHPMSKSTVYLFAILFQLSLTETNELLRQAGFIFYTTAPDSFDWAMRYFIINKIYDISIINMFFRHYLSADGLRVTYNPYKKTLKSLPFEV